MPLAASRARARRSWRVLPGPSGMPSARWRSSAASRTASGTSRPARRPASSPRSASSRCRPRASASSLSCARPSAASASDTSSRNWRDSARRAARSRSRLRFSSASLVVLGRGRSQCLALAARGDLAPQVGGSSPPRARPARSRRRAGAAAPRPPSAGPAAGGAGTSRRPLLSCARGAASGSALPRRFPADRPRLPAGVLLPAGTARRSGTVPPRRPPPDLGPWPQTRAPRPGHRRLRSPRRAARRPLRAYGHRTPGPVRSPPSAVTTGRREPVADFLAKSLIPHQGVNQAAAMNA